MRLSPAQRPAALLLDLDGTLIDSEGLHWETATRIVARFGHRLAPEDAPRYVGYGEIDFWQAIRTQFGLPLSAEELGNERSAEVERAAQERPVPHRPHAAKLLEVAGTMGIPRILASAAPRRQIDALLASAALRHALDDIVSGHDDVQRSKPFPDVYIEAARRAGTTPALAWIIEDSKTGLRAARAAEGGFVVGVPTRLTQVQELDADVLYEDLGSVVQLLLEL